MDEPILKRRKLASPKAKGLDQLVQEFGERFVPIPEYNTIGMCRVLKDMSRELHRYDSLQLANLRDALTYLIDDIDEQVFACHDCGGNTVEEWYMVHDAVWAKGGLDKHGGKLCIGCLENRLGRTLRPDDFNDAPINREIMTDRSLRLRDRLGGAA